MKKLHILLVVMMALGGCAGIDVHATSYEERAVALQNLIAGLQSALARVGEEVEKKTDLELGEASLSLNTALGKSAEAGAGLLVVSGKTSQSDETYDTLVVKLVPLKPMKAMADTPAKTLSERLAISIVSAVEGVSKAGTGEYPLLVEHITINVGITAKTATSAGGGLELEVIPLSLSGKGTYSKSDSNVLTLTFVRKK
jgi:hypothetical protein